VWLGRDSFAATDGDETLTAIFCRDLDALDCRDRTGHPSRSAYATETVAAGGPDGKAPTRAGSRSNRYLTATPAMTAPAIATPQPNKRLDTRCPLRRRPVSPGTERRLPIGNVGPSVSSLGHSDLPDPEREGLSKCGCRDPVTGPAWLGSNESY
jgi:hypothetical protein